MTDTLKLCKHGSLRRHCEICDLAEDLDRLQAENALLKEALRDAALPEEPGTPRTDAEKEYLSFELDANGQCIPLVKKSFARQLERELAKAINIAGKP